jgi:hypothetical protein
LYCPQNIQAQPAMLDPIEDLYITRTKKTTKNNNTKLETPNQCIDSAGQNDDPTISNAAYLDLNNAWTCTR